MVGAEMSALDLSHNSAHGPNTTMARVPFNFVINIEDTSWFELISNGKLSTCLSLTRFTATHN